MASIGIDVGGSKILGIVADSKGRVHKSIKVPTPAIGSRKVLQSIKDIVHALSNHTKPKKIGIGFPGFIEENSKIKNLTNIKGFNNFNLKKNLCFPGTKLAIDNDVNCMALAEKKWGALKDIENGLCITIGTGVGGSLILNGKLFRGSNGFAGEIGHIIVKQDGWKCGCGKKGCLESMINKKAVRKRAIKKGLGNISPQKVEELSEKGNKKAIKVYEETAQYLAIGLDNAIQLFDPEKIVLAGGISNSKVLLKETIKQVKKLSVSGKKVFIQKSPLGKESVALGASIL